jgi:putative holliday junction resolvase
MRAIGIDLGSVRVGIAISDELGLMAHPRPHLPGSSWPALLEALAALARDESIDHFVVGLPRQLDGTEGRPAREARRFALALAQRTGIEVTLCDEWLTTREARARLHAGGKSDKQSRSRIDSAAAAVLLQSWLDARPRESAG